VWRTPVPVQLVVVNQSNTATTATVIRATVATAVTVVVAVDVAHAVMEPLSPVQRRSTMVTLI